ncbi:MAG: YgjV family protein [Oscillospiraceae bacterium]
MIAQLIGVIATAFLLLSFQAKTKKKLYLLQATFSAIFIVHFALLHQPVGAAMQVVGLLRCLFLFFDTPFTNSKTALVILSVITVGLAAFTFDGFISLFPPAVLFISTFIMWFCDIKAIKKCQFFMFSPLWIIYDITAGSYSGIINELLAMSSVVIYWVRSRNSETSQVKIKEEELATESN